MRTYLWTIAAVAACDAGMAPTPEQPGPDDDRPAPMVGRAVVLPAEFAAEHALTVIAEQGDGPASARDELDLGLADGWPRRVTISGQEAYVFADGCPLHPGEITWRSISAVDGDAAQVEVVDGDLVLDLVAEGELTLRVTGEIGEQECDDGPTVTFEHELVVRVRRVRGFVLESFHQQLFGCDDRAVLPTDAPLWAPEARPLAGDGLAFAAINAPRPVEITLRSPGELRLDHAGKLWADAGEVTIDVATTLPVTGLRALRIVGPEALTAVEAGLYLQRTATKGTTSEPIVDGSEYPLFHPDQPNTVDIRVDAATTTFGELCAHVPGEWFAATSATPGQCTPSAAIAPDVVNPVPLAEIVGPGECRLAVTIAGTDLEWATRFSTTL